MKRMPPPDPAQTTDLGFFERANRIVPVETVCKHQAGSCEKCGTSDRRDTYHETVGGRGKVGQAIARSKKKK